MIRDKFSRTKDPFKSLDIGKNNSKKIEKIIEELMSKMEKLYIPRWKPTFLNGCLINIEFSYSKMYMKKLEIYLKKKKYKYKLNYLKNFDAVQVDLLDYEIHVNYSMNPF